MWLSDEQIKSIGFRSVGQGVQISSAALFYGAERIDIGSHSRIDAFSLISAGSGFVRLGRHVHVSAGAKLYGTAGIDLEDFAGVSVNSVLLSASDDFIQGHLTNPTIPDKFRMITRKGIVVNRHGLVGANSVLLPGSSIGIGGAIGANSLLSKPLTDFAIAMGNPARQIGVRSRELLEKLEAGLRLECSCFSQN